MNRELLALDFYGNELIAALAVLDEETDTLRLRHVLRKPCRSFAGAFVRDMAGAQEELSAVLNEMAEYTASSLTVIVGLRGQFLSFKRSSGFQSVSTRNRIISPRDEDAAIRNSVPTSLSDSLEVIDILPQNYTIDGNTGITDPKGMSGFMLEVETFLSCALVTHLNTLSSVLNTCGISEYQILPSIIAQGETLLTREEKQAGALLLDIGQAGTSAIVYHKGALVDAWELSNGREDLAQAVADLLQNDLATAKEVLRTYEPGSDEIMDELLEDANEKMLIAIKKELLQSLLYLKYPSPHVVLCGAWADTTLLKQCKKVFGARKARLGNFDQFITDITADHPAYAGTVSLIRHALDREQKQLGIAQEKEHGLIDGLLDKLGFGQLF